MISDYTDIHIQIHKLAKMLSQEGGAIPGLSGLLELELDTGNVKLNDCFDT